MIQTTWRFPGATPAFMREEADQGSREIRRGGVRLITIGETTLPLGQWAKRLGCRPETIRQRLVTGWSMERACTEPVIRNREVA